MLEGNCLFVWKVRVGEGRLLKVFSLFSSSGDKLVDEELDMICFVYVIEMLDNEL